MGVRKNAVYITAMQVSNVLLGLLLTPYVTRVLGSAQLGISSFGFAVAGYFSVFSLLGLPIYGLREVAKHRDEPEALQRIFSLGITFQLFFSLLSMLLFSLWAITMPDGNSRYYLLFLFFLLGTATDLTWFYAGVERYDKVALRTVLIRVVGTLSIVLLVRDKEQLALFIMLQQGAVSLSNISYWLPLRKHGVRIRLAPLVETLRIMFLPSLWLFFPIVLSAVILSSDRIFLNYFCDKSDVAIYDFPARLARIGVTMVTVVGNVMMPRLSNLWHKGGGVEFREALGRQVFFGLFFGSLMGGGLMATSGPVSRLMFGTSFTGAGQVLFILAPAVALSGIALYHAGMAIGRERDVLRCLLAGAVVNVVANIFLIPTYGVRGAAFAYLFTEFALEAMYIYTLRDVVQVKAILAQASVSLLISALGVSLSLLLHSQNDFVDFLVKGSAFAIIFLPLSLILFPRLRAKLLETVRGTLQKWGIVKA